MLNILFTAVAAAQVPPAEPAPTAGEWTCAAKQHLAQDTLPVRLPLQESTLLQPPMGWGQYRATSQHAQLPGLPQRVLGRHLFDSSCVDVCAGDPAVVAAAAVAPELLGAAVTIPKPPAPEELPVPTEESAAAASAAAAARGAAYQAEQAAAGG